MIKESSQISSEKINYSKNSFATRTLIGSKSWIFKNKWIIKILKGNMGEFLYKPGMKGLSHWNEKLKVLEKKFINPAK